VNFNKILIVCLLLSFVSLTNSFAEEHESKEKDIVEKAKEINQQVKKQMAEQEKNISSEITSQEEPLPLNDPFVGDASLASGSSSLSGKISEEELQNELSLYNFKLVAIMTGEYESYVSLINASGEILTLQLHEELSEGVKLIALKPEEAVFQKADEKYLIINFKNQIKETSEAF
tara:strand:- start:470 stop:994 length:525 start_codon:yes stop_codon:yes gene_type:complete